MTEFNVQTRATEKQAATERPSATPGPWKRQGLLVYALHEMEPASYENGVPRLTNVFSCQVQGNGKHGATVGELEAIARLIAAAPELLAACKRAKKLLEPEVTKDPDRTIFWELVDAIRKAEGK